MSNYSEASLRVFEQALDTLKGKLDDSRVEALRELVACGQLGDLIEVERILEPKGADDAG